MLVAIDKDFWQADDETRQQLAEQFSNNILSVGLPGSGHSHANHPVYDMVKAALPADQAEALESVLAKSRMTSEAQNSPAPSHLREVRIDEPKTNESHSGSAEADAGEASAVGHKATLRWLGLALLVILLLGLWRGSRGV